MKYRLGTLKLSEVDIQSAVEVIDSNQLSPGPKVKAFEEQFSSYHNQDHGVMVNSGTDALRIALAALKEKNNWKDGDVVLCPSVTFVATVNVILQLNLKPYLVDVGMYDFNMNPDNLFWRHMTSSDADKWKCVIPVHLAGRPCNMYGILKFAKSWGLSVLEDSCECMGVEGIALGDATAFSFYVAHILTTGVGGMATTNDQDLAKLMWSYANHGRRKIGSFEFDRLGYSCRSTEFEAAIGLNQLPGLQEMIDTRRRNSFYLSRHLSSEDFYAPYFPDSACMFQIIQIKEDSKLNKFEVMEQLDKCGVECRELMPITTQPCYKGLWNPDEYPMAKAVNERAFYIGCHQDMQLKDLQEIVEVFKGVTHGRLPSARQT